MGNPRFKAIAQITQRGSIQSKHPVPENPEEIFGELVFNRAVMQKMLPRDVYKNVIDAMERKQKISPEHADTIAVAMKEWAISHGATHYSHWFQPLISAAAEKHDSFIDWSTDDEVLEKFSGKQLIQGEPDASSFPSGGLRSTYEARGYTGWDPTSPVFLWKGGDGITLCIPSVFFSWTGDVLDQKIPLLRSDKKINDACLRLLKLTGLKAEYVYSTLGLEQEYFVIDRALRNLRPDLVLAGKTVFGAHSPKGQELQDHYFGTVKDRILNFMHDFENAAIKLAIPVKTRHNEVAPAQHEVAPVFERASKAIDHNLVLMELMRQIAGQHDLACLLHEKPFNELNGSGKHSNWSLSTDTGINLLDPSDAPGNNFHFLILMTAILHAVHEHASLLRASIGSASNDYRLGGHEAPPAIISVYLGQELEDIFANIEEKGSHSGARTKHKYDLGLPVIPDLSKDNTDRNRTSPFAFTGNKFEFRAVGSSASPAFPTTVLNVIVAESLNRILDEIEAGTQTADVLKKYLKKSRHIRFSGDNYSEAWAKEAEKRGLPNIHKSVYAFEAVKDVKTVKAFEGILTKSELESRYEIMLERYALSINIEANLMLDMFSTQILPAAIKSQKEYAKSILATSEVLGKVPAQQKAVLNGLTALIENAIKLYEKLKETREKVYALSNAKRAKGYSDDVMDQMEKFREVVDQLEMQVDDSIWPLPKYRELLFLI